MEWPTHPTPGTPSHVPTSGGGGVGGSSDRGSLRDGSGSSATTVPIPLLHGSSGTAAGSGARTGSSNGVRGNGSGNGHGSTDSVRDSSGQVEYGRRQGASTRPSLSEAGVHIGGVGDGTRAGDDSDDSGGSSSEAGVLTDNVPGVLAAAQVMRAVRYVRVRIAVPPLRFLAASGVTSPPDHPMCGDVRLCHATACGALQRAR